MKKLINTLLSLTLLISVVSCKKALDVEPRATVPDATSIIDKASAETALRGAYRQLGSSGYYGQNYVTLGFFPSGDITNNTTGGGQNLIDLNLRSDDGLFSSSWASIYVVINRANHIIEKVPGIRDPQLSSTDRNRILGEAYFLRALSYFDLARGWGGVQLFLTPTKELGNNNTGVPRSSLEQTYNQVLNDLIQAESLLPNTVNRLRATQKTVWALRARLHLYREEWADAEFYASKVIDDGGYTLVFPFKAWFADNVLASQESIFEVSFSPQNPNTIRDQVQHPTNGGTYRFTASNNFVNLLRDPAIGGGPDGRRALIDSVVQGATEIWNIDLYYREADTDPAYVLRLAEMYLIRAEARAEQEVDLSGALNDINAVRNRANIADLDPSVDTFDEILDAVDQERRFEFAFEAHRYFDLARTGRLKQVVEGIDPTRNVASHEYVFPIPISQVQLDPSLKQNPGYN